jgi:hypothetical protein
MNTEKKIMIVKPDTISAKDKKELTKNNVLVIEHPFPGDVRILSEADSISGDDLLMSGLKAVAHGSMSNKADFFNEMFHRFYKPKKQAS